MMFEIVKSKIHLLIPLLILFGICCCGLGTIIRPLGEEKVKLVLKEFNSQGIVLTQPIDETAQSDEMKWYDTERGYFCLEGFSNEWFFLYVTDINNDGKDECILAGGGGSGAFLRIDAVYQKQGSRLVDIFDEIRVPMWRLVRGKDKEDYDSVECGEIIIKTKKNKTFFTLYEHARNRDAEGFKYFPPKKWKFLWENGHIQLLEYKGPT